MRIALGCDKAGAELKEAIEAHLTAKGAKVCLFAPDDIEDLDYPVYAQRAAGAVARGEFDAGVLICGTGAGMAICANKIEGLRAVVCSESYTARMAKEHNNANILCFGARVIGRETAKAIVDAWFDAKFQGGRHQRRVDMYKEIEKSDYTSEK